MGCNTSRVVLGEECEVRACSHGVHLSIGKVTLHLSREQFRAVAAALSVGERRLSTKDGMEAAPPQRLHS